MGYACSNHALQRYAERIKGKEDRRSIEIFANGNRSDIEKQINTLIEHSRLVYEGKSLTEYNKEDVQVFLHRDGWVNIVSAKGIIITIYKIALGLDEELDKVYLDRIFDRMDKLHEQRDMRLKEIQVSRAEYETILSDVDAQIVELKEQLKNLEQLKESYEEVKKNLSIEEQIANQELREFTAKILGRKVF